MATLSEAFEAVKAGKRVTNRYREEVFCKKGSLRWGNDDPVEVWNETLEGWIIEEPQKLEYVDYPVVAAPTPRVEMPNDNKHDLDLIWTQAGFAGYVFVTPEGTRMVCSCPFKVNNKSEDLAYMSVEDKDYDGITWCDFVRFTGRAQ